MNLPAQPATGQSRNLRHLDREKRRRQRVGAAEKPQDMICAPAPTPKQWGTPPWRIDFRVKVFPIEDRVDFVIVGGGLTGLSAATWLKKMAPERTVVLLEAATVGSGASGRSGGMVLADTAAGKMPGLGNVIRGFRSTLDELGIHCDYRTSRVWELGRTGGTRCALDWTDSGRLRVTKTVEGGSVDPGKLATGLARTAENLGVSIVQLSPARAVRADGDPLVFVHNKWVRARHLLIATNAQSWELSGLAAGTEPKFTLATCTEPLDDRQVRALGLASRRPFYTTDLPYLWGRALKNNALVFGSGLVDVRSQQQLDDLSVSSGRPRRMLRTLEKRIRGLHPVLRNIAFTHRWGGPILLTPGARPVFRAHPQLPRTIALGGYNGHGVALSVYLGRWAAEAMLKERALPDWS